MSTDVIRTTGRRRGQHGGTLAQDPHWASASEVMRVLGIGRRSLERFRTERVLGTRSLPGCATQYSRADLGRLAQTSVIPAIAPAQAG